MYFPTSISEKQRSTSASRLTTGLAILAFAYGCHAAPEHATSTTSTQINEHGIQNPSEAASQTELARDWGLTPKSGPVIKWLWRDHAGSIRQVWIR